MKKIMCFIICMVIPISAFAVTDLEIMIEGHNLNCGICAAQQLIGDPTMDGDNAIFDITPKLHDVFFTKEGEVTGFGCVCQDPAQEVEFLAQCVTACLNFGGTVDTVYDAVLSQFMFARAGNPLGGTVIPGMLIEITKESFGYVFVMSKVK